MLNRVPDIYIILFKNMGIFVINFSLVDLAKYNLISLVPIARIGNIKAEHGCIH